MRENWGFRGMPPIYVEVAHKMPTYQSEHREEWQYWIKGHYPHWGKPIDGWSGPETIVKRETIKGPTNEHEMYEDIEYPITRIRK